VPHKQYEVGTVIDRLGGAATRPVPSSLSNM